MPWDRQLCCALALCLTAGLAGLAGGQPPDHPELFQAGVYADDARTVTCVTGAAGDHFKQVIWAWVPDSLGLAYITLRFESPDNIDFSARPHFNDLVEDVIITPYNNETSEWNMLLRECPCGWVRVFSQDCLLLDDQPAHIGIQGEHSMMRDCIAFFLNDSEVLSELRINDPGCGMVPTGAMAWGTLKCRYRLHAVR